MAIDAYTGLPRSGKSYSVVKNVILPSLQQGREVYTNIPLTEIAHDQFPGLIHQLERDWFSDLQLFDKFPAGSVVVLDELWRRWPSGLKSNMVPFADKEFLAEHGHNVSADGHTTRVVLVTQDLSQVAAFVRDLVDKTYRSTKLDAVGANSRFRIDIYQGSVTGQRPPKSQLIRTMFDQYSDDVYRYYKSSTKSQRVDGEVGDESRADNRSNLLRSPVLIASFVVPLLVIPLVIWWLYGYFISGFGMIEEQPVEAVITNPAPVQHSGYAPSPAAVVAVPARAAPVAPQIVDSVMWRVVGGIQRAQESDRFKLPDVVMLRSVYGLFRYVPTSDCELLPDRLNWSCMVDGSRAAPWTGTGDGANWASSERLVTGTASAASGATSGGSASNGVPVNPAPTSTTTVQ